MKLRRILVTSAFALILLATTASASTPDQIVARLNAERVANGIPGGLRLDPSWTLGCEHHIRYEALNGIGYTHDETPGKPGYTKDGAFAASTGDQANNGTFDGGDPFDNLPLHLANLLAPRLATIGASDGDGRSCIVVSLGYTRQFKANAIFVATANGRSNVAPAQVVRNETPFAPGDLVGLPQGTTHGPTIYVFAAGPWAGGDWVAVKKAQLLGPSGPVTLRIVDGKRQPQLATYIPLGACFLIPISPLAAGATYRASVTLASSDGTTLSKTWRFTTA